MNPHISPHPLTIVSLIDLAEDTLPSLYIINLWECVIHEEGLLATTFLDANSVCVSKLSFRLESGTELFPIKSCT